jgi:hypothetical protein
MSDKRTEIIYLRLPPALRKAIEQGAEVNMRTLTQQIQYLVEQGLYVTKFKPGFYKRQVRKIDET